MKKLKHFDVYVAQSKLEGMNAEKNRGVFADRDFKKGSLIMRCPVIPVNKKDYEEFENNQNVMIYYVFSWNNEKQACVTLGYGSLLNHSEEKCNVDYIENLKLQTMDFYAWTNIKKDDELFIDYGYQP